MPKATTTIRVSERTKEAIDSFRDEGQSIGDAVEEMADELGLFGHRRVDDFRSTLREEYGFGDPEMADIEDALRIFYTKWSPDITLSEEAVAEIQDQVTILKRLGLITTESSRYTLTDGGELIASKVTEEFLCDQQGVFQELTADRSPQFLAFLIEFGFHRHKGHGTGTNHLTVNLSVLNTESPSEIPSGNYWWDETSVVESEYESLLETLRQSGIAVSRVGGNALDEDDIVLPPEFRPVLADHSPDLDEALTRMECYKTTLQVANDEFEVDTREKMLETLQLASEDDLRNLVTELHDEGYVSQYTEKETPFLVNDTEGIVAAIRQEIPEVSGDG